MAKEKNKATKTTYRAKNPSQFKEWFNASVAGFKDLSEGKSVELKSTKLVENWLKNNIIVKE
jgi:hypothetical protein